MSEMLTDETMENSNFTMTTEGSTVPDFQTTTENYLLENVLLASTVFLASLVCVLLLVILGLWRYILQLRTTSRSNSRLISRFTKSGPKEDTGASTYETVGNSNKTIVQQQPMGVKTVEFRKDHDVELKCENGSEIVKDIVHEERKSIFKALDKGRESKIQEGINKATDESLTITEIPDPKKGTVRYAKINKNKPSFVRDSNPGETVSDSKNIQRASSATTDDAP